MEEKKILSTEEVLQRAKAQELSDEELDKINGGAPNNVGWAWNPVYAIKTWPSKDEVVFIFNYGDSLKIWEFFGGGDEGIVRNREAVYSSEDGGWIDKYLVDTGDEVNWWCKRDAIVYQD